MPWVLFAVSTIVIVLAGTKVARCGDRIAELTGLGRLWIGAVLVATATSLPELFTDVSAALLDAPDLAVGDLFGSNMANMLILGIIDLLHRQKRVWQQAAYGQTLIAALAMALTGLAGALILFKVGITHLGVGLGSLLLLIIYVLGMRVVYRQEDVHRRQKESVRVVEAGKDLGAATIRHAALKRALGGFSLAALAILVAAPFLATSAKDIAEMTGISQTYIGTSLVAITTSLPELVTALAAVRLGAFDLAVGNLFGSNAFNMAVLFIVDVAYRSGPLLSAVSPAHAITALWSIILMNIGLMGIIYRAEKRFLLIEPDSLLIIVSYALGMWLLA
jgi:cation:H+ antiporter